ncbi:hypothetical protein NPIL_434801 [Nephila pilipes]|uniref:Uncharacterized protein n=1 Tax=Nephila pilipes TaxID=299642 RepID=A0A8X6KAP3_NEPPI|nr:hypothetical protein NPIL_434801 [Nephila pilipes]
MFAVACERPLSVAINVAEKFTSLSCGFEGQCQGRPDQYSGTRTFGCRPGTLPPLETRCRVLIGVGMLTVFAGGD